MLPYFDTLRMRSVLSKQTTETVEQNQERLKNAFIGLAPIELERPESVGMGPDIVIMRKGIDKDIFIEFMGEYGGTKELEAAIEISVDIVNNLNMNHAKYLFGQRYELTDLIDTYWDFLYHSSYFDEYFYPLVFSRNYAVGYEHGFTLPILLGTRINRQEIPLDDGLILRGYKKLYDWPAGYQPRDMHGEYGQQLAFYNRGFEFFVDVNENLEFYQKWKGSDMYYITYWQDFEWVFTGDKFSTIRNYSEGQSIQLDFDITTTAQTNAELGQSNEGILPEQKAFQVSMATIPYANLYRLGMDSGHTIEDTIELYVIDQPENNDIESTIVIGIDWASNDELDELYTEYRLQFVGEDLSNIAFHPFITKRMASQFFLVRGVNRFEMMESIFSYPLPLNLSTLSGETVRWLRALAEKGIIKLDKVE